MKLKAELAPSVLILFFLCTSFTFAANDNAGDKNHQDLYPAEFWTALKIGDIDTLNKLYPEESDIPSFRKKGTNSYSTWRGPPIETTATYNQIEAAEWLKQRGAIVTGKTWYNAIKSSNTDFVKWLISQNEELNILCLVEYRYGYITPLSIAALYNRSEITSLLLDAGASVSLRGQQNSPGQFLESSLSFASSPEVAILLINHGADVNEIAEGGFSQQEYPKEASDLFSELKDDRYSTYRGGTPLNWACRSGRLDVVQTLINYGAVVNQKNGYGVTPLMAASFCGQEKIVEYLIEKGALINERDYIHCSTAMMQAAYQGHLGIVKILLAKGADPALLYYAQRKADRPPGSSKYLDAYSKPTDEVHVYNALDLAKIQGYQEVVSVLSQCSRAHFRPTEDVNLSNDNSTIEHGRLTRIYLSIPLILLLLLMLAKVRMRRKG
ncbi:MAG: ankyrin repeat domain-containing protein [Candidatus Wallbacteria bacterium]|nr:ankyrin repeat domain-containing protein [Candidatus Wallbacteria bacterium]